MGSKKNLLGVVGFATAVLTGKACYDNVTLIESSLEPHPSAVWRFGSKDYVITNSSLGSRSLSLSLDYSTYYNNGWMTCSSGPSHPSRWRKDLTLGNQVLSIEMNNYFGHPDDFIPCMYSSSFQTYKIAP